MFFLRTPSSIWTNFQRTCLIIKLELNSIHDWKLWSFPGMTSSTWETLVREHLEEFFRYNPNHPIVTNYIVVVNERAICWREWCFKTNIGLQNLILKQFLSLYFQIEIVAIVVVSNETQTRHLNSPTGNLVIFYCFYHIWHLCILFYWYLWILSRDNNISGSRWNTGLVNQLKFLFSSLVIYWDFNFS